MAGYDVLTHFYSTTTTTIPDQEVYFRLIVILFTLRLDVSLLTLRLEFFKKNFLIF
jgi:hypothetical protein